MTPMKAIRKHCLDCCCGSSKAVKYCTCDGINGTRCFLWPFRFGKRPKTLARKGLGWLLDPRQMPSADISLDEVGNGECPGSQSGGVSEKSASAAGEKNAPGPATGQEETSVRGEGQQSRVCPPSASSPPVGGAADPKERP